MTVLEKNIQALLSGVNEPLGNKLLNFIQTQTCSRFSMDENFNIYDKENNVFMYQNMDEEINYFHQAILEKTLRYPFACIYGIGNALLIKNLSSSYKHLFVFESEIELFVLALGAVDLSEELCSGKIYLVDINEEKVNLQLRILFDQDDMFEWLNLYEMFMNSYYKKYFIKEIAKIDDLIYDNINFIIRNLNPKSNIALMCYDNFIQNIPLMLNSIPFKRIVNERKGLFENCVVVCAGPSLEKQISLLKQYQENFVIFCADGAYPLLIKNDIIPDYVLNVDLEEYPLEFFKNIQEEKLQQTLFVLAQNTHPCVSNFMNNQTLNFCIVLNKNIVYQKINAYDFGYLEVGTHVGHMCYTLALALEFKNIIIIGQDLAYNEDGHSHFNDFILGQAAESNLELPKYKILAYKGKGEVFTHIGWDDYKKKLEGLFARNSKINFYNATEGGARIAFTKEFSFEECCKKFTNFKKKILNAPKKLALNESDEILKKVLEILKQDLINTKQILDDAKLLHDALEKILFSKKDLSLEFLSNVFKNIENFDILINHNSILNDGILKGVLFYRGFELSKIISQQIKEEKQFLFLMIKTYKDWLVLLIEKLDTKKKSLERLF
ncbi:motility associated factor glycosyltransferase family protein [Campylobacter hepaticus]